MTTREGAFGESSTPTHIDRLGIWLGEQLVRRRVGSLVGKKLADIGCGYYAITSRPYLGQVRAAFLADLALAPDLVTNPVVTPLIGELPDSLTEVPDHHVDVVFCLNIHEHVDQPEKLLTECRRILIPGGPFFITVPSWTGKVFLEFSAFRLNDGREEMEDHKRYYSKHDLWLALRAAGFLPSGIRVRHAKFGLSIFGMARA